MSIANLFVPNDLDLFCGTITTKSGGNDTFGSITLTNTTNQITMGTTNTTTLNSPAPSAPITLNLPNSANDTLVARTTTDTLSNKTLAGFINTGYSKGGSLTAPTFVLGASGVVGIGASCTIAGNQQSFIITLNTGSPISSNGLIMTVTLPLAGPGSFVTVIFTPANSPAVQVDAAVYAVGSGNQNFTINGISNIIGNTTYIWNCMIGF